MKELSASKKQCGKYGIFSFFTGAGFLDLGFEDAGFTAVSGVFSHAETQKATGSDMIATVKCHTNRGCDTMFGMRRCRINLPNGAIT